MFCFFGALNATDADANSDCLIGATLVSNNDEEYWYNINNTSQNNDTNCDNLADIIDSCHEYATNTTLLFDRLDVNNINVSSVTTDCDLLFIDDIFFFNNESNQNGINLTSNHASINSITFKSINTTYNETFGNVSDSVMTTIQLFLQTKAFLTATNYPGAIVLQNLKFISNGERNDLGNNNRTFLDVYNSRLDIISVEFANITFFNNIVSGTRNSVINIENSDFENIEFVSLFDLGDGSRLTIQNSTFTDNIISNFVRVGLDCQFVCIDCTISYNLFIDDRYETFATAIECGDGGNGGNGTILFESSIIDNNMFDNESNDLYNNSSNNTTYDGFTSMNLFYVTNNSCSIYLNNSIFENNDYQNGTFLYISDLNSSIDSNYNDTTVIYMNNCIFDANYATSLFFIESVNLYFYSNHCSFTNNHAIYDTAGGGILHAMTDTFEMTFDWQNMIFINNSAYSHGNVAYLQGFISFVCSNCTFHSNNFLGNVSTQGGVIMSSYNGQVSLINCIATNHDASNGSVIYSHDSSLIKLVGGTYLNNTSEYYGGSIYCFQSKLDITDTYFMHNFATIAGGAIYGHNNDINLTNINCYDNHGNDNGGCINHYGDNNDKNYLYINNSRFSNNSAYQGGTIGTQQNDNSFLYVTIENSNYTYNDASYEASILWITRGQAYINNSGFYKNQAYFEGGVMCLMTGSLFVYDSIFEENRVYGTNANGGVFLIGSLSNSGISNISSIHISDSVFDGNQGVRGAGVMALFAIPQHFMFEHNYVANNYGGRSSGVIAFVTRNLGTQLQYNEVTLSFLNNEFIRNGANYFGGVFGLWPSSHDPDSLASIRVLFEFSVYLHLPFYFLLLRWAFTMCVLCLCFVTTDLETMCIKTIIVKQA